MNSDERSSNLDSLWQQGQKFKQEGSLDRAIAVFKQLIKSEPNPASAYHFLGECWTQKNELSSAVVAYQQAIQLNPDNPWTHHCLGQVLFWQGDIVGAISSSQKSLELEPQQFAFHAQLGEYLTRKGDSAKAIAAYQKAIALNSQLPEIKYSQLITLLLAQEKIDSAFDINNLALEKYPYSSTFYFQRGNIYTAKKYLSEAKASYNKAIELEPNFWDAYQNLGDILIKLGESDAAQQAYQEAESRFFAAQEFDRADLPSDFDWQIYLALNPEFDFSSKFEAIAHLIQYGLEENKLYALPHLHDPQKRPDIAPQSIVDSNLQSGNINLSTSNKKLAVLIHIYYFDLWWELKEYIENIRVGFDLYVNIVATIWQPQMHDRIREHFPQAKIIISSNRGKDIGGHLSLMSYINFEEYDLFCLIHTKKSPHIDSRISDIWRQDLLNAILGSVEKAQDNLSLMREYPSIGLLGSRYWRSTEVGNNQKNYQYLIERLAITDKAQPCEYLSGTMMLIRTQIVQEIYEKLHNLELESGDNRELSFHIDGQIAHAIERIIGNLVRDRGLKFFWQE